MSHAVTAIRWPRGRGRHIAPYVWSWPLVIAGFLIVCVAPTAALAQQTAQADTLVRFTLFFSSRMLTDVHENDAKAAVRAWANALTQERNISAELEPQVVNGVSSIGDALRSGQADVITVPTDEYLALGVDPAPSRCFLSNVDGRVTEEYLILVHREATIEDLRGLEGHTVLMFENARTALAPFWLDTALLRNGLPPASRHFGQVENVKKLSSALLPVFFGQADACVVTRRSLEVMSELNPQVGKQLMVLDASSALVPCVGFVLPRSEDKLTTVNLLDEIGRLQTTAGGRQILNLFQADRITTLPISELDESLQLLETHRRLMAEWENESTRRVASAVQPEASAHESTGDRQ